MDKTDKSQYKVTLQPARVKNDALSTLAVACFAANVTMSVR
jgi:hypothetical protein